MFGIFSSKQKRTECKARHYDTIYKNGGVAGRYHVHYSESRYYPVWNRAAEILAEIGDPRILDIGCGPGQFANLVNDRGMNQYRGIDYSCMAIELAKATVPGWVDRFAMVDVFKPGSIPKDVDIIVMFEVLEHMERDLDLIAAIPAGTRVLFSVPSYDSKNHVRHFKSARQVKRRYAPSVDITRFESFTGCPEDGKTVYLVDGRIRPSNH